MARITFFLSILLCTLTAAAQHALLVNSPSTPPAWAPGDITSPNLLALLDARALTGYTNGQSITSTPDQFETSRTYTFSGTTAPTYNSSVLNGNPGIDFSQAGRLEFIGTLTPTSITAYSVVVVARIDDGITYDAGTIQWIFLLNQNNYAIGAHNLQSFNTYIYTATSPSYPGGAIPGTGYTTGGWQIAYGTSGTGMSVFQSSYLSGLTALSETNTNAYTGLTTGNDGVFIGSNRTGQASNNYFDGSILYLAVYGKQFTTDELHNYRDWIIDEFGPF